jgi:hypothetical protein
MYMRQQLAQCTNLPYSKIDELVNLPIGEKTIITLYSSVRHDMFIEYANECGYTVRY